MKSLVIMLLMVAILAVAAPCAKAAEAQDLSRSGVCQDDIQKFCENVRPGKGRILKCMKQYDAHLADTCRAHIHEVKEKTAYFAKACQTDVRKFCPGIPAGEGRLYSCLKENRASLAARCADFIR